MTIRGLSPNNFVISTLTKIYRDFCDLMQSFRAKVMGKKGQIPTINGPSITNLKLQVQPSNIINLVDQGIVTNPSVIPEVNIITISNAPKNPFTKAPSYS